VKDDLHSSFNLKNLSEAIFSEVPNYCCAFKTVFRLFLIKILRTLSVLSKAKLETRNGR
jgi:hypothetical protein